MKLELRRMIVIIIIISIIPIIFYLLNFSNTTISDNPTDWASFSDFLSLFVSVSNLIVFIYFSFQLYEYNALKDNQDSEFKAANERPILTCRSIIKSDKELWVVKNIGRGAALNLKISEIPNRLEKSELTFIKCFSLGETDEIELDWISFANVIVILYEDIFSNKYVTVVADDESKMCQRNDKKGIVIENKSYNINDFESFDTSETKRFHNRLPKTTSSSSTNPG
jgi:hypothetical protein